MKKTVALVLILLAGGAYLAYQHGKLPWIGTPDGGSKTTNPDRGKNVPDPKPPVPKGDSLLAEKRYSEALTEFEREHAEVGKIVSLAPDAQGRDAKRLAQVEARIGECHVRVGEGLAQEKKLYEARAEFSEALRFPLPTEQLEDVKARIIKLNETLIFSLALTPDSVCYTVVAGDILKKIAEKHGVTYESIMRVNRMKRDSIRIGEVLKILQGTYSIEISLSRKRLSLWIDDNFIGEYPVGIGKPESPTPIGTFKVKTRLPNPVWWAPDGKQYEFGHPQNILGTRWMGFKERPRCGIHGTTQPDTIGKESSDGCVRMNNRDVEEVFDFVPIGTKVIISE